MMASRLQHDKAEISVVFSYLSTGTTQRTVNVQLSRRFSLSPC